VRIAIISDVHANLAALEAVIADWGTVDAVWHLGDLVGYGPDPVECVERLRSLTSVSLAGNHDWAAIGRLDPSDFNALALEAIRWTAQQLTPQVRSYLAGLPTMHIAGDFTLVHGSPRDPIREYVLSTSVARACFAAFDSQVCFIGHSHIPLGFRLQSDTGKVEPLPLSYAETELGTDRQLINVGSVGQPRDGDPAARYLILDTDRRCYQRRRVEYPIEQTQERMRRAGLPSALWLRLAYGR
jgi:diadenosine tetraphosphatase ApaH/serine/threonine PP2A family protein phosphatase